MINENPSDPMTPRAAGCLLLGLEELDMLTEAPLRLRAHASAEGHEVFHVQEEFELGPRGRRFLLSIDARRSDAMLVPVGGLPEWS